MACSPPARLDGCGRIRSTTRTTTISTCPALRLAKAESLHPRPCRFATLLAAILIPIAASAAREPVLKQVDLPHSYYWREMYLPQLTTGPSGAASRRTAPASSTAWAARCGGKRSASDRGSRAHASGRGYDYQPDWSQRWPLRRVRALRRQCDGAVAARPRHRPRAGADADRAQSTSSRAFARRQALAWVSTAGHGALQPLHRRPRRAGAQQCAAAARAARRHARSLLLLGVRSRDQSVAGRPDGKRLLFRRQSRGRLGHGRHLVGVGRRIPPTRKRVWSRKPPGARGRNCRPTASACCTAATRAGNGISSG